MRACSTTNWSASSADRGFGPYTLERGENRVGQDVVHPGRQSWMPSAVGPVSLGCPTNGPVRNAYRSDRGSPA
jgi:hypothetical protein